MPNECLIPITQLGCPFAKKREKDMKATHGPCEDNVIEPDHIICIFHGKICLVIVFHVICIRLIIFQSMFAILVIWISVAIHNIDKTCLPGWLSGQSLEGMPQQPASWHGLGHSSVVIVATCVAWHCFKAKHYHHRSMTFLKRWFHRRKLVLPDPIQSIGCSYGVLLRLPL